MSRAGEYRLTADDHRLSQLKEREGEIRGALTRGVITAEPGRFIHYFPRAELREELNEIAVEVAEIRRRQQRARPVAAAATSEGRTSGPGRLTRPRNQRESTLKHLKHIFAAAVVLADILFGTALPEVMRNLHKETQSHQYGSIALYGVLALLTLWVIVSVVRGVSDSTPKPPARTGYGNLFGGGR